MADSTTLSFECSIPGLLEGKVEVSDPYQNYHAKGNPTSFGVDLHFEEMHMVKSEIRHQLSLLP